MTSFSSGFSMLTLITTLLICTTVLAFYRLVLHPLAKFPGPRLAALTRYYEAYYDVMQDGQYTFKIAELHRSYGKLQCSSTPGYTLTVTSRSDCKD